MDKQILQDYMDACALIRETEEDIRKLRRKCKTELQYSVRGSNPDFPYEERRFRIHGLAATYADERMLRMEERLLEERKARAQEIKLQVEQWMLTVPARMQRIIRFRCFQRLPWEEVAAKMGGQATEGSLKMEFQRFIQEK